MEYRAVYQLVVVLAVRVDLADLAAHVDPAIADLADLAAHVSRVALATIVRVLRAVLVALVVLAVHMCAHLR